MLKTMVVVMVKRDESYMTLKHRAHYEKLF